MEGTAEVTPADAMLPYAHNYFTSLQYVSTFGTANSSTSTDAESTDVTMLDSVNHSCPLFRYQGWIGVAA